MTTEELKERLSAILSVKETGEVDWARVHELSQTLAEDLGRNPPSEYPRDLIAIYLSSTERRRTDGVFGHAQRTELVTFLRSR